MVGKKSFEKIALSISWKKVIITFNVHMDLSFHWVLDYPIQSRSVKMYIQKSLCDWRYLFQQFISFDSWFPVRGICGKGDRGLLDWFPIWLDSNSNFFKHFKQRKGADKFLSNRWIVEKQCLKKYVRLSKASIECLKKHSFTLFVLRIEKIQLSACSRYTPLWLCIKNVIFHLLIIKTLFYTILIEPLFEALTS